MLADPLTKPMGAERLVETLRTGVFDMQPTEESMRAKTRNRAARKVMKEKKSPTPLQDAFVKATERRTGRAFTNPQEDWEARQND